MKKHLILFIVITAIACLAATPGFSQDPPGDGQAWLTDLLSELERTRDDAVSQIDRAQSRVASAGQILVRARQENNAEAAGLAEQALHAARTAEGKARDKKLKAEETIAGVRSLLAVKTNPRSQAVAGESSGDVRYVSKRSQETLSLTGDRPRSLEPGDGIVTAEDGRVRVHVLGGRGTMDVGEKTRLSVEENAQGEPVINLQQGRIDVVVEKLQAYEQTMNEYLKSCGQTLSAAKRMTEQEVGGAVEEMQKVARKFAKRFEIRSPTAVIGIRGTRLSVETDALKGTNIAVFEGRVELKDIKGRTYPFETTVDAGYKVRVSPEGIISRPEKIGLP
jgi:type II secretory pathway pseudopilin PulG